MEGYPSRVRDDRFGDCAISFFGMSPYVEEPPEMCRLRRPWKCCVMVPRISGSTSWCIHTYRWDNLGNEASSCRIAPSEDIVT